MPGDGRISGVGQTQFLKTNTPLARTQLVGDTSGKESLDQNLVQVFPHQLCLNGAANKLGPLAQEGNGATLSLGRLKELFLREAGLMPQAVQLPGIDAVTRGFKALLQISYCRSAAAISPCARLSVRKP